MGEKNNYREVENDIIKGHFLGSNYLWGMAFTYPYLEGFDRKIKDKSSVRFMFEI